MKRRIVFRYKSGQNTNGSKADIAGIVNEDGNMLGTMPHPERTVESDQQAAFEVFAQERGVFVQQLGTVTDEPTIHVTTAERTHILNKANLESLWQHALPTLLNPS